MSDKLTKELGKLEERKRQLIKEREQATAELTACRASAAELVLTGIDSDKIADKIHRLEIRLQALSGALSLLAEQDRAKREEIQAAERAEAIEELKKIDSQAEQAFIGVIDAYFKAADALQAFESLALSGIALAGRYQLPTGRGVRLHTWGETLYNGLADAIYQIKSTDTAKYLNGRVLTPRTAPLSRDISPLTGRKPVTDIYVDIHEPTGEYLPPAVDISEPFAFIPPPKPGYLR